MTMFCLFVFVLFLYKNWYSVFLGVVDVVFTGFLFFFFFFEQYGNSILYIIYTRL